MKRGYHIELLLLENILRFHHIFQCYKNRVSVEFISLRNAANLFNSIDFSS